MGSLQEGDKQEKHTKAHNDFFFNDTATTEIYTLSLHDALPILARISCVLRRLQKSTSIGSHNVAHFSGWTFDVDAQDRKSTRLNSSHLVSSYAVFCLKKKEGEPYEGA